VLGVRPVLRGQEDNLIIDLIEDLDAVAKLLNISINIPPNLVPGTGAACVSRVVHACVCARVCVLSFLSRGCTMGCLPVRCEGLSDWEAGGKGVSPDSCAPAAALDLCATRLRFLGQRE
jgi:hypothetical protein